MDTPHLQMHWYTRRGGVIRGPFSADEFTRHFILGRIRGDDELSRDLLSWAAAKDCTDLLPGELRNLSGRDNYQQLAIARMRADERKGELRRRQRSNTSECHPERRTVTDRRGKGNERQLSQYLFGRTLPSTINAAFRRNLGPLLLTMLLVTAVLTWLVPN